MAGELVLPEDIGEDKPSVTFRQIKCRACDEASDWAPQENTAVYDWQTDHATTTRHTKFYVYQVTRNTARVML